MSYQPTENQLFGYSLTHETKEIIHELIEQAREDALQLVMSTQPDKIVSAQAGHIKGQIQILRYLLELDDTAKDIRLASNLTSE